MVSLVLALSSDRSLGLSIVEGKDDAESFKLVESGKAAAFLAGDLLLVSLKANAKNPDGYGFLSDAYPGVPYALMLGKDDSTFMDLVNGVLAEAMRSGEYAKLYTKWFESPIPPKNVNLAYPMPEELKKLVKMVAERLALNKICRLWRPAFERVKKSAKGLWRVEFRARPSSPRRRGSIQQLVL